MGPVSQPEVRKRALQLRRLCGAAEALRGTSPEKILETVMYPYVWADGGEERVLGRDGEGLGQFRVFSLPYMQCLQKMTSEYQEQMGLEHPLLGVNTLDELFTLLEKVGSFMEAYYTHFSNVFRAPLPQGGFTQADVEKARRAGVEEGKAVGGKSGMEQKKAVADAFAQGHTKGKLSLFDQLYNKDGTHKAGITPAKVMEVWGNLGGAPAGPVRSPAVAGGGGAGAGGAPSPPKPRWSHRPK
jgi:hypothetical protein